MSIILQLKKCGSMLIGGLSPSLDHVNMNIILLHLKYISFLYTIFPMPSISTVFLLILLKSHAHSFYYSTFLLRDISSKNNPWLTPYRIILSFQWQAHNLHYSGQGVAQYPKGACHTCHRGRCQNCLFLSLHWTIMLYVFKTVLWFINHFFFFFYINKMTTMKILCYNEITFCVDLVLNHITNERT